MCLHGQDNQPENKDPYKNIIGESSDEIQSNNVLKMLANFMSKRI